MKRQIILDTETTGMPAKDGHRIIEIGCVEIIDREITGNYYHQYINPDREVDRGAFEVHGIGNDDLADKPYMSEIVDSFLDFIQDSELVIHNARFDIGFLDYELELLGKKIKISDRCPVIDTLALARKKYPGARVSLDALTKRYGINNFNRELHGALLDAEILAQVYLIMTGGQAGLGLNTDLPKAINGKNEDKISKGYQIASVPLSSEEKEAHQTFFKK